MSNSINKNKSLCPSCGKALEEAEKAKDKQEYSSAFPQPDALSLSKGQPGSYAAPQPYQQIDPDEINLLEYIYVLVKHKWWIIGTTIAGLALGYVAALIKGPTWTATAVIAPKETEKSAPNISGFGAFGGIVASQLGLGGNASLEKIDVVLGSRKFNAEMIEKYNYF